MREREVKSDYVLYILISGALCYHFPWHIPLLYIVLGVVLGQEGRKLFFQAICSFRCPDNENI